jgi:hypothetical protein
LHITIDEAAAMYARFYAARHGDRALPITMRQIEMLKKRGDQSGVEAWTKVAEALERLNGADRKDGQ